MAMFAVADHINKDITVEFLAVTGRQFTYLHHGLHVIAIYMEHGSFHHGGEAGTVVGRTGIIKISGKPDLVIDHEMNSASGIIPLQLTHLQHFISYSLPCQGGISMNKQG